MRLQSFVLAAAGPAGTVALPAICLAYWIPYARRARTLARQGRPPPAWRRVCFAAGLVTLVIALSPPVGDLSQQLLTVHMVEHLLIGDVAALLLVLGLTGPLLAPLVRITVIDRLRLLTNPAVAFPVWAINLYVWHLPLLYQAALRSDLVHAIEHTSFLAFGMAMWMALLGPFPKPGWFGNGGRLAYIIAVRVTGTVLGNVFLFAGTVIYPYYRGGDSLWHFTPLGDQITAGAVMMIEESVLTIALFCWLFLKAASEGEQRQRLLEYASAHEIPLSEKRASRAISAGRVDELWQRLSLQAGNATTEAAASEAEHSPLQSPGADGHSNIDEPS